MSEVKIDWTKPLVHYKGAKGKEISYIGRMEERNSKPIKDGCHHLVIVRGGARYYDDYGRIKTATGTLQRAISNIPEKAPPASAKTHEPSPDMQLAHTIRLALRAELDTLREEMIERFTRIEEALTAPTPMDCDSEDETYVPTESAAQL